MNIVKFTPYLIVYNCNTLKFFKNTIISHRGGYIESCYSFEDNDLVGDLFSNPTYKEHEFVNNCISIANPNLYREKLNNRYIAYQYIYNFKKSLFDKKVDINLECENTTGIFKSSNSLRKAFDNYVNYKHEQCDTFVDALNDIYNSSMPISQEDVDIINEVPRERETLRVLDLGSNFKDSTEIVVLTNDVVVYLTLLLITESSRFNLDDYYTYGMSDTEFMYRLSCMEEYKEYRGLLDCCDKHSNNINKSGIII